MLSCGVCLARLCIVSKTKLIIMQLVADCNLKTLVYGHETNIEHTPWSAPEIVLWSSSARTRWEAFSASPDPTAVLHGKRKGEECGKRTDEGSL